MAKIICGRFDRTIDADAALAALSRQGFTDQDVDAFYVGPAGQHAKNPWGGDSYAGEGARRAGSGGIIGALGGAVVGALVGWLIVGAEGYGLIVVAIGAAVGAYIGSFAGAMWRVRGGRKSAASVEHPVEPRGGRMIAVNVDRPGTQERALAILKEHRARDLGRAEGEWRDGSWKDFDPRAPLAAV